MPFPRPTLTELQALASADATASDLQGADGFLRRSWLRVMAWVQAGMSNLHYGFLDWIARMSVPFTAQDEYLVSWASLKAVNRLAATKAVSPAGQGVAFTGSGGVIPNAYQINRGDGAAFVTTASGTISAGTVTVPVIAVDAGALGNTDASTQFQLSTSIAGIDATGTATAAFIGGSDQETDTSLRNRMLLAFAKPPQGGAGSDYVEWALEVPGVTRAWCLPLGNGPGTAIVYTMFDVTEAAHAGFPQGTNGVATLENRDTAATGDQLAVANFIFPLRPVTALVYSYAPVASTQNFTVGGLDPDTTDMRTSVSAAIGGMLTLKDSPLADTPIDQSDVDGAILAIPGINSFRVTAPGFPINTGTGSIAVLGTVGFV